MADLGYRENVMGPQPISKIVAPPSAMIEAVDKLVHALMRGDHREVEAMTEAQAQGDMRQIESAIAPGVYAKYEIVGRARVSKHFYSKVRLPGAVPIVFQVRLGQSGERWTVREAINLTGRRSGWSK